MNRLKAEADKAKKERTQLEDALEKAKSKADDSSIRLDTVKAEAETEKMMLETAKIKAESAGIKSTGVAAIKSSSGGAKTSTLVKDCVVRDQPEKGKQIGALKKGNKVNLTGDTKGDWVQLENPDGYVHKHCVK